MVHITFEQFLHHTNAEVLIINKLKEAGPRLYELNYDRRHKHCKLLYKKFYDVKLRDSVIKYGLILKPMPNSFKSQFLLFPQKNNNKDECSSNGTSENKSEQKIKNKSPSLEDKYKNDLPSTSSAFVHKTRLLPSNENKIPTKTKLKPKSKKQPNSKPDNSSNTYKIPPVSGPKKRKSLEKQSSSKKSAKITNYFATNSINDDETLNPNKIKLRKRILESPNEKIEIEPLTKRSKVSMKSDTKERDPEIIKNNISPLSSKTNSEEKKIKEKMEKKNKCDGKKNKIIKSRIKKPDIQCSDDVASDDCDINSNNSIINVMTSEDSKDKKIENNSSPAKSLLPKRNRTEDYRKTSNTMEEMLLKSPGKEKKPEKGLSRDDIKLWIAEGQKALEDNEEDNKKQCTESRPYNNKVFREDVHVGYKLQTIKAHPDKVKKFIKYWLKFEIQMRKGINLQATTLSETSKSKILSAFNEMTYEDFQSLINVQRWTSLGKSINELENHYTAFIRKEKSWPAVHIELTKLQSYLNSKGIKGSISLKNIPPRLLSFDEVLEKTNIKECISLSCDEPPESYKELLSLCKREYENCCCKGVWSEGLKFNDKTEEGGSSQDMSIELFTEPSMSSSPPKVILDSENINQKDSPALQNLQHSSKKSLAKSDQNDIADNSQNSTKAAAIRQRKSRKWGPKSRRKYSSGSDDGLEIRINHICGDAEQPVLKNTIESIVPIDTQELNRILVHSPTKLPNEKRECLPNSKKNMEKVVDNYNLEIQIKHIFGDAEQPVLKNTIEPMVPIDTQELNRILAPSQPQLLIDKRANILQSKKRVEKVVENNELEIRIKNICGDAEQPVLKNTIEPMGPIDTQELNRILSPSLPQSLIDIRENILQSKRRVEKVFENNEIEIRIKNICGDAEQPVLKNTIEPMGPIETQELNRILAPSLPQSLTDIRENILQSKRRVEKAVESNELETRIKDICGDAEQPVLKNTTVPIDIQELNRILSNSQTETLMENEKVISNSKKISSADKDLCADSTTHSLEKVVNNNQRIVITELEQAFIKTTKTSGIISVPLETDKIIPPSPNIFEYSEESNPKSSHIHITNDTSKNPTNVVSMEKPLQCNVMDESMNDKSSNEHKSLEKSNLIPSSPNLFQSSGESNTECVDTQSIEVQTQESVYVPCESNMGFNTEQNNFSISMNEASESEDPFGESNASHEKTVVIRSDHSSVIEIFDSQNTNLCEELNVSDNSTSVDGNLDSNVVEGKTTQEAETVGNQDSNVNADKTMNNVLDSEETMAVERLLLSHQIVETIGNIDSNLDNMDNTMHNVLDSEETIVLKQLLLSNETVESPKPIEEFPESTNKPKYKNKDNLPPEPSSSHEISNIVDSINNTSEPASSSSTDAVNAHSDIAHSKENENSVTIVKSEDRIPDASKVAVNSAKTIENLNKSPSEENLQSIEPERDDTSINSISLIKSTDIQKDLNEDGKHTKDKPTLDHDTEKITKELVKNLETEISPSSDSMKNLKVVVKREIFSESFSQYDDDVQIVEIPHSEAMVIDDEETAPELLEALLCNPTQTKHPPTAVVNTSILQPTSSSSIYLDNFPQAQQFPSNFDLTQSQSNLNQSSNESMNENAHSRTATKTTVNNCDASDQQIFKTPHNKNKSCISPKVTKNKSMEKTSVCKIKVAHNNPSCSSKSKDHVQLSEEMSEMSYVSIEPQNIPSDIELTQTSLDKSAEVSGKNVEKTNKASIQQEANENSEDNFQGSGVSMLVCISNSFDETNKTSMNLEQRPKNIEKTIKSEECLNLNNTQNFSPPPKQNRDMETIKTEKNKRGTDEEDVVCNKVEKQPATTLPNELSDRTGDLELLENSSEELKNVVSVEDIEENDECCRNPSKDITQNQAQTSGDSDKHFNIIEDENVKDKELSIESQKDYIEAVQSKEKPFSSMTDINNIEMLKENADSSVDITQSDSESGDIEFIELSDEEDNFSTDSSTSMKDNKGQKREVTKKSENSLNKDETIDTVGKNSYRKVTGRTNNSVEVGIPANDSGDVELIEVSDEEDNISVNGSAPLLKSSRVSDVNEFMKANERQSRKVAKKSENSLNEKETIRNVDTVQQNLYPKVKARTNSNSSTGEVVPSANDSGDDVELIEVSEEEDDVSVNCSASLLKSSRVRYVNKSIKSNKRQSKKVDKKSENSLNEKKTIGNVDTVQQNESLKVTERTNANSSGEVMLSANDSDDDVELIEVSEEEDNVSVDCSASLSQSSSIMHNLNKSLKDNGQSKEVANNLENSFKEEDNTRNGEAIEQNVYPKLAAFTNTSSSVEALVDSNDVEFKQLSEKKDDTSGDCAASSSEQNHNPKVTVETNTPIYHVLHSKTNTFEILNAHESGANICEEATNQLDQNFIKESEKPLKACKVKIPKFNTLNNRDTNSSSTMQSPEEKKSYLEVPIEAKQLPEGFDDLVLKAKEDCQESKTVALSNEAIETSTPAKVNEKNSVIEKFPTKDVVSNKGDISKTLEYDPIENECEQINELKEQNDGNNVKSNSKNGSKPRQIPTETCKHLTRTVSENVDLTSSTTVTSKHLGNTNVLADDHSVNVNTDNEIELEAENSPTNQEIDSKRNTNQTGTLTVVHCISSETDEGFLAKNATDVAKDIDKIIETTTTPQDDDDKSEKKCSLVTDKSKEPIEELTDSSEQFSEISQANDKLKKNVDGNAEDINLVHTLMASDKIVPAPSSEVFNKVKNTSENETYSQSFGKTDAIVFSASTQVELSVSNQNDDEEESSEPTNGSSVEFIDFSFYLSSDDDNCNKNDDNSKEEKFSHTSSFEKSLNISDAKAKSQAKNDKLLENVNDGSNYILPPSTIPNISSEIPNDGNALTHKSTTNKDLNSNEIESSCNTTLNCVSSSNVSLNLHKSNNSVISNTSKTTTIAKNHLKTDFQNENAQDLSCENKTSNTLNVFETVELVDKENSEKTNQLSRDCDPVNQVMDNSKSNLKDLQPEKPLHQENIQLSKSLQLQVIEESKAVDLNIGKVIHKENTQAPPIDAFSLNTGNVLNAQNTHVDVNTHLIDEQSLDKDQGHSERNQSNFSNHLKNLQDAVEKITKLKKNVNRKRKTVNDWSMCLRYSQPLVIPQKSPTTDLQQFHTERQQLSNIHHYEVVMRSHKSNLQKLSQKSSQETTEIITNNIEPTSAAELNTEVLHPDEGPQTFSSQRLSRESSEKSTEIITNNIEPTISSNLKTITEFLHPDEGPQTFSLQRLSQESSEKSTEIIKNHIEPTISSNLKTITEVHLSEVPQNSAFQQISEESTEMTKKSVALSTKLKNITLQGFIPIEIFQNLQTSNEDFIEVPIMIEKRLLNIIPPMDALSESVRKNPTQKTHQLKINVEFKFDEQQPACLVEDPIAMFRDKINTQNINLISGNGRGTKNAKEEITSKIKVVHKTPPKKLPIRLENKPKTKIPLPSISKKKTTPKKSSKLPDFVQQKTHAFPSIPLKPCNKPIKTKPPSLLTVEECDFLIEDASQTSATTTTTVSQILGTDCTYFENSELLRNLDEICIPHHPEVPALQIEQLPPQVIESTPTTCKVTNLIPIILSEGVTARTVWQVNLKWKSQKAMSIEVRFNVNRRPMIACDESAKLLFNFTPDIWSDVHRVLREIDHFEYKRRVFKNKFKTTSLHKVLRQLFNSSIQVVDVKLINDCYNPYTICEKNTPVYRKPFQCLTKGIDPDILRKMRFLKQSLENNNNYEVN